MSEPVKIVRIAPTRIWIERPQSDNILGSSDLCVFMQHESDEKPFEFARIGYNYRYTDNSHQRRTAEAIVAWLEGKIP